MHLAQPQTHRTPTPDWPGRAMYREARAWIAVNKTCNARIQKYEGSAIRWVAQPGAGAAVFKVAAPVVGLLSPPMQASARPLQRGTSQAIPRRIRRYCRKHHQTRPRHTVKYRIQAKHGAAADRVGREVERACSRIPTTKSMRSLRRKTRCLHHQLSRTLQRLPSFLWVPGAIRSLVSKLSKTRTSCDPALIRLFL